jgi:hypothetical protein
MYFAIDMHQIPHVYNSALYYSSFAITDVLLRCLSETAFMRVQISYEATLLACHSAIRPIGVGVCNFVSGLPLPFEGLPASYSAALSPRGPQRISMARPSSHTCGHTGAFGDTNAYGYHLRK